jgi:hypothetical protein
MNYGRALGARRGAVLWHRTLKNADGTPMRCRVTGRCKTWKRRPGDWRLPVKYGLRECFCLTPDNCDEWLVVDPTETKGGDA